jgi:hypothetical protein
MSKRQIRRREASSGSDDEDAPARRPARQPAAKAVKAATLSFGGGDEEEGGEDDEIFVVKKSKASRTVKKKMRQAPNAASVIENAVISSDTIASAGAAGGGGGGGEYSAESLAALRNSQHFSTAPVPVPDEQPAEEPADMELAGDEAVLAEDQLGGGDDLGAAGSKAGRGGGDMLKQQSKADKNKVRFASAIPKDDDRDRDFRDLDAQDADASRWEEELLRRAGAGAGDRLAPAGGPPLPSQQARKNNDTAKFEELTFTDCMKSLVGGIAKLEDNCENNRSKLMNMQNTYNDSEKEKIELKAKVVAMAEVQDWIEVSVSAPSACVYSYILLHNLLHN